MTQFVSTYRASTLPTGVLVVVLLLVSVATSTRAPSGIIDDEGFEEARLLAEYVKEGDAADGDNGSPTTKGALFVGNYLDAALVSIIAWNVMVITLEVNDFRYRLMAVYDDGHNNDDDNPSSPGITSRRYVASLMAIRYGLCDAIIDWSIIYSIGWGIVGGITWKSVEPNSVVVIWGFSLMSSAIIVQTSGVHIPQWLGLYRVSQHHLLNDTSNLAPRAVQDLSEGSSVASFRHQVRLGVGKHFSQFVYFLTPFYVGLKVWAYLLSIFIGFSFGQIFLFVVFKCRQRFKGHRGQVAICASSFLSVISALVFMYGVQVVNTGWQRAIGKEAIVLPLSFFLWLAICLLRQGLKYCEHRRYSTKEDSVRNSASLVADYTAERHNMTSKPEIGIETLMAGNETAEDGLVPSAIALEEPFSDDSSSHRRSIMKGTMETQNESFTHRQTVDFGHVKFHLQDFTDTDGVCVGLGENITPREVYDSCAAGEEPNIKWYHRAWKFLPFQPAWNLFILGTRGSFSCCCKHSDANAMACSQHFGIITFNTLKVLINLVALFLAIVACGSTIQTKITESKLPYVKDIYATLNEGRVCAYDEKCGTIETFACRGEAHAANYTIAHCGKCSHCSTWNDLELQWSSRDNAAASAQTCGLKSFTGGRAAMLTCLETQMGWTKDCADAWAHSIECAKENCVFIAIQSMITNRMGNFKVDKNSISAATCNEAQCEQGNPGRFADLSGASRRKMNIRSSILRPPSQQCQIVDNIPKDAEGYNNWGPFFDEPCPRKNAPP